MTASDADADSGSMPAFDPTIDLPTLAKATWGPFLTGAPNPDAGTAPVGADWTNLQPPPPALASAGTQPVVAAQLFDGSQLEPFDPPGGLTLDPQSETTPLGLDAWNVLQTYGVGPAEIAHDAGMLGSDLGLPGPQAAADAYQVADNGGFTLNKTLVPNVRNAPRGAGSPDGEPNGLAGAKTLPASPGGAGPKMSPALQTPPKFGTNDVARDFRSDAGAPSPVSDAAAFGAITANESGTAGKADRMTAPQPKGGGWTIGWEQEDFGGNSTTAQATLTKALTASGYLDSGNAQKAAAAFTAARESPKVNLNGIVDTQGNPVDLDAINNALSSKAASSSIYNSSYENYTRQSNLLMAHIAGDPKTLPAVKAALSDPTYGPLARLVILDYNNQMPARQGTSDGMADFLRTGSVQRRDGSTTSLDQSSPKSVMNSIMKYYLDTQYVTKGGGEDVGRRLTNDVQAAANAHVGPPRGPISVTSRNGTMMIAPASVGNSYQWTWKRTP